MKSVRMELVVCVVREKRCLMMGKDLIMREDGVGFLKWVSWVLR
jgi:hypothetical protein